MLHDFFLLLESLHGGSGGLIRPGKSIRQRSHRNVPINLAASPKYGGQAAIDRVSEVGKNALQTLETAAADIGLVLCGLEAHNASLFCFSRVACRALRSFSHV